MSRRKKNSGESLDMLLDTITNTFGSLIFIAILVALLVGQKQPEAKQQEVSIQPELDTLASRVKSLQNEIDLKRQNKKLQDQLADQFVNQEQAKLAARVVVTRDSVKRTETEIQQLQRQIQKTSEELNKANQKRDDLQSLSAAIKQELAQEQRKLENEKAKRTTNFDSPVLKATRKSPQVFMVKNKRLYVIGQNRLSGRFSVNSTDFERATSLDAELNLGSSLGYWKTKAAGGIRLADKSQLKNVFRKVDNKDSFVNLAIFEDSFDEFQSLREVFVDAGLEYSLLLLKSGEQVVESSSAQRPKVQ